MGEVKIYLPDELKKEFKKRSMETFGYGRGSISKAAEQAIRMWTSEKETVGREHPEETENSVHILRGMLKGEKESSVELQHKARKLRAKNSRS